MPPRLEIRNARKQFPGVLALDNVSVAVNPGEVLAVIGENGAGKSTLMKIAAGIYIPEAGEIVLDGEPVRFAGPADAMAKNVHLIHQELNLAENLNVAENVFLGREETTLGPLRMLKTGAMIADTRRLLERVGLPKEIATRRVETLAPGEKQLVEIARAIGGNARVLIFDEPTSSLTQKETEQLYKVIDALRADGVSIMYISHRLAEVTRCADRVVVLRDGRNAGELAKNETSHDAMVRLMVGRDMKSYYPRTEKTPGNAVLELRGVVLAGSHRLAATRSGAMEINDHNEPPGLSRWNVTPDESTGINPVAREEIGISFTVRAGEILGMAGLVGAGRTELAEAVFGIRSIASGELLLNGEPFRVRRPKDAIERGVLLVPEDRRAHGLVLEESVGFNLSLPNLDRLSQWFGIQRGAERELHADSIRKLAIKTPSAAQSVGLLSGGNQQKVVYGKWLAREPKVLILDEPTRGVDVGAKAEIYTIIDNLARQGVAIWMITSDMEELLGMADRVLVLHEGRLAGELTRERLTEERVMTLATGGSLG